MRPFDVERLLEAPGGIGHRPGLIDNGKGGVGQTKRDIEGVQIVGDIGIVVRLDEGDCLSRAITSRRA